MAAARRAVELLREEANPRGGFSAVEAMVAERIPVNVGCRVLAVSESGYYERLERAPSERAVRHAWLTDLIT